MPSRSDLTAALRTHLQGERFARHPLPEELAAYHEQRLSADEADEIRAHLVACPDCVAELLGLADLSEEKDDPRSEVSRAEMDAAWQRQRAQILPSPPASFTPAGRSIAPVRFAWAAAASLGLAATLLAVVAIAQWRTIATLRQPLANPPLVNLAPAGSVRQETGEASKLLLPARAQRIWVILNPIRELNAPAYDVEILAPQGQAVLRFKDLQPSEAANFRLEIPRTVLREGDYRILLFAKKAGSRQVLEEFELNVRLAPPPAP